MTKVEPAIYDDLTPKQRRAIREQYAISQKGLCMHCNERLDLPPPKRITTMKINWRRFPPNFLKYLVHLQHDHKTGLTEGAVHSYCNAVLWQYHGR